MLDVFTQRNFAADFFSTEVEFYWQKQQNRVLCHTVGDLGVTYTVHLWLVEKGVVDFLLVLLELFRHLSRLRRYERILVKIFLFERGWVTLSTNFRGKVGRLATKTSPWAITWCCLCDPSFSHFDTILACDTDRQTDTR